MATTNKQLEVAAHWLEEAAVALSQDKYLVANLRRVADACLKAARKENG